MTTEDNVHKKYQLLEKKIAEIVEATQGNTFVFRGENSTGYEKMSCTLYREQVKVIQENIEKDTQEETIHKLNFPAIEQEIIKKARRLFPTATSDLEILTTLQHYGGKTTLIDFTRNIPTALFFACWGEPEKPAKDGRIICLNTKDIRKEEQELYSQRYEKELVLIEPSQHSGGTRVVAQHSVFVHCPDGFLKKDTSDKTIITIEAEEKQGILQALERYYDIKEDTVFNDIQGFIESANSYKTAEMYFYIASSHAEKNEYKKAIENYDKAIELQPDHVAAYYNRGNSKVRLKQYDEAIKDYDTAIELQPDNVGAYYNRGNSKASLDKHEEAIADYDKAITLKSDFAEAYNNRGNAKYELGKYDEAIADYDKAIELKPDDVEAYYNRGYAKAEQGKYDEAIADYNKAIALDPSDADTYNNRGTAQYKLGKYNEAIADYNKVIELDPKFASAHQNRAKAKARLKGAKK